VGGGDEEFEDFLRRRTPTFRRAPDDLLEPPPELDRIVLRKAREAIEAERPQRVYQGPGWGAPLAVAATLLLAFTVILQVGMPKKAPIPEVTVQTVAQRLDYPAAAPAAAPAAEPMAVKREVTSPAPQERRAVMADASLNASAPALVSQEEADRYAPAPPPAPSAARARANTDTAQSGVVVEDRMTGSRNVVASVPPPPTEAQRALAKASSTPEWRRDSKTWLAEIERLRATGRSAEADAELAEFKREHRAYAVAPDK
jgi:hypothetical protein